MLFVAIDYCLLRLKSKQAYWYWHPFLAKKCVRVPKIKVRTEALQRTPMTIREYCKLCKTM